MQLRKTLEPVYCVNSWWFPKQHNLKISNKCFNCLWKHELKHAGVIRRTQREMSINYSWCLVASRLFWDVHLLLCLAKKQGLYTIYFSRLGKGLKETGLFKIKPIQVVPKDPSYDHFCSTGQLSYAPLTSPVPKRGYIHNLPGLFKFSRGWRSSRICSMTLE